MEDLKQSLLEARLRLAAERSKREQDRMPLYEADIELEIRVIERELNPPKPKE